MREALLDRRRQSHLLRQELDERWQGLHEREPELEEAASKENIARGLEEQNNQLQEQIESIDAALGRMDEGTYGKCESCRRPIAIKRLQAIPWTRMCLSCSQARGRLDPPSSPHAPAAAGKTGLSDDEILDAVYDALDNDGRIDQEELLVSAEDGIVYLEGYLPSEEQQQILIEIVQDTLGFEETVDEVVIDRQLWERRKRDRPSMEDPMKEADPRLEEDPGADPYTSMTTGEIMSPPERFRPEKK